MTRLLEALDTIRFHDPGSFSIFGRLIRTDPASPEKQRTAVEEALYAFLHCRVPVRNMAQSGFSSWAMAREYADALSRANSGQGPWQGGWLKRDSAPDGRAIVERHGVRFWTAPERFRAPGELRIPKEYFDLVPGFYLALGDYDLPRGQGDIVRIYWHLVPRGGPELVSQTSARFNRAAIPFQLKILADPLRFDRSDPAVIYLARGDYPRARPILREVFAAVGCYVRSRVSWFVKPIAPGVGLAEDPGDGGSFGEHRSRLLAGLLLEGNLRGAPVPAGSIPSGLEQRGYRLETFYLQPGSNDMYPELAA